MTRRCGGPAGIRFLLVAAVEAFLVAGTILGQFASSTQVGPTPPPEIAGFEAVKTGMEEALWDLRPLRLDPWIGIVDAGFIDSVSVSAENGEANLDEASFDFRVIGGGGLRAYVPAGQHVILAANVLEEYNAWVDDSDLNRANFSWETGLFVHGNRLDLQLEASTREEQAFATSEIQQIGNSRTEAVEAAFEVRMVRSLYLFAGAAERDFENESLQDEDAASPVFSDLDRREEVYRSGLRFLLGRTVDLAVGYETSETDFEVTDRSNEATAPFLEFNYQGPRIALLFEVARYDVEPTPGSILLPFEETTGNAWLDLNAGGRVGVALYGRRYASYSVTTDFSHFVQQIYGVEVGVPITDQVRLTFFGETGTDDYAPVPTSQARRQDDIVGWGGSVRIPLARRIGFSIDGSQQKFSSDFPGADRDVSRIGIGFDFGLGLGGRVSWPSWP